MPPTPRRILFLAEGQIGDLLLLTPAIRAVRASFPTSHIAVLVVTRRGNAGSTGEIIEKVPPGDGDSILATNPHLNAVYVLNRERLKRTSGWERLRLEARVLKFMRRLNVDTTISTFPEDRFALWSRASGARTRVGDRTSPMSFFYTHYSTTNKGERGVLRYYLDEVGVLGASAEGEQTEYRVPDRCKAWADRTLVERGFADGRDFVAIHPGASGNYKIWPPDRFGALADLLHERTELPVAIVCGESERGLARTIQSSTRTHPTIMETGEHIGNLGGIFSRASLAITNDSGPRHLAVAVGTPAISIFRLHHDREWKAYEDSNTIVTLVPPIDACSVCGPGACRDVIPAGENYGAHCLRSIGVESVLRASLVILQKG